MTDPTHTNQAPPQGLTDAQLDALERQYWKVESNIEYEPGAGFAEALDRHETFQHRAFARAAIAADRGARVELVSPQVLTDKQLLELADGEIEADDVLPVDEYEAANERAIEIYGSELIAAMRAAIAAHEAARPRLTPEEVEARFRAWWAELFPNAPAGLHAVASHVAYALHLLGGEVAA